MLSSKYDWKLNTNKPDQNQVEELASELGLDSLVVAMLIDRGYTDLDEIKHFLQPDESDLLDPFLMHDMDKAVQRIQRAVENNEKITVYGDYDADGLTSTSIMYETLVEMGADAHYYIPNRFTDGYGPNSDAFKRIIDGGTSLIITVDNGVAGYDEIEEANQQGCDVIITDHHELPDKLPNAYAIVHAALGNPRYPFAYLSGAGIAFKVATALMDEIPQDKMDLAAIGTVADLVSLTGENRALVQFGLNVIHLTVRPGLKALIKRAGISLNQVDETDIGFKIAPMLNALGRMEKADSGVELLTTVDESQADRLAKETEKKNEDRKALVSTITDEAVVQASSKENQGRETLMIVGNGWHTGVLGIVASRLTDKFHKPTVVLSIDEKTKTAKGSGRSVDGFNLFKALNPSRNLMESFGGHEAACGLTIPVQNLDKVAASFETEAKKQKIDLDKKPVLDIAFKVTSDELDKGLYQQLQRLSPFGTDNPRPEFEITPETLKNVQAIGQGKDHLKFQLLGTRSSLNAIDFGCGEQAQEVSQLADNIDVAGNLTLNEWKGRTSLQVMVDDLRVAGKIVSDQRTSHLSKKMFANPGIYVFFNQKLLKQLQQYLGQDAEAILAADIAKPINAEQAYIVDMPTSNTELEQVLQQLDVSKLCFICIKNT